MSAPILTLSTPLRDTEECVLSAILLDNRAIESVVGVLRGVDFETRQLGALYDAAVSLFQMGRTIDPVTLSAEAHRLGSVNGSLEEVKLYIGDLHDLLPFADNVRHYADIVIDAAKNRAAAKLFSQLAAHAASGKMKPSELATAALRAGTALAGDSVRLPSAISADAAGEPEPIRFAIAGLCTAGDIGLFVGDGGSFKSTVGIHCAAAKAGGYPVFDRFPTIQAPSLIVSAEDSDSVIRMRLRAMCVGHGWDEERVMANVHVFPTTDISLADLKWQAHIATEAKRLGVGFVVLDPWADLIGGDENSNSENRPVVKWARKLAQDTGAAVVVVHHAGKAGPDKRSLDRIRGASALPSAARTILFFDYKDTGVHVEHLKMSRAPKLEPFVVHRQITADPDNRTMWQSARLGFEVARVMHTNRAEEFVLTALRTNPKQSTRALRTASTGTGIRSADVQTAINNLAAAGRIVAAEGPRGAMNWEVRGQSAERANTLGHGEKTTVTTVPRPCSTHSPTLPLTVPAPLGAGHGHGDGADAVVTVDPKVP